MNKPTQKNTNRIAKVNSHIEHELGALLREFSGDDGTLVTVSKVETTKDMKEAVVWISVLGNAEKTLARLQASIYQIQGALNARFTSKIIPKIRFKLDLSPEYAEHISELIKKIHENDAA